jgi:hypothetical protein
VGTIARRNLKRTNTPVHWRWERRRGGKAYYSTTSTDRLQNIIGVF